ncbi:hypothetical protein G7067_03965 [Leucobacter insecticola]|uniref:Uncharacterized protein n=1 Tax=Leucobacter insecticola TaxID=2714934 RepID=A0A6G8FHB8_9MICO|nr:hypothetical protein [Leucobacter insecticola]QIM15761.1 hypothetical protein G7067_03965 [Leucobacter insecticola]
MIGIPFVSSILAGIAMVFAFVVGLPLRLVRVLRHWWVTRGWIFAIAFAVVGLIGIPVAFYWPMPEEIPVDPNQPTLIAAVGLNVLLCLGSMMLAGLGLSHLVRPMKRNASPRPAPAIHRQ